MTYKVIVQDPAENDAFEYAEYICVQNQEREQAKKWLNELQLTVLSLSEMPRRFPVIEEQTTFAIELRQFLHYSHRVIFHVNDTESTVYVLRIYHVRRDALRAGDI